jgi:hypothetical protein
MTGFFAVKNGVFESNSSFTYVGELIKFAYADGMLRIGACRRRQ